MNPYVLVVESNPELQKRIGEALREARYELSAETELGWAKRSLAVRQPQAIIVDTSLSDGSGFALADDIRKDPETRKTPIFFIASRFRGASHRAEAMRRFAPAEYLSTPLDVDSMLALLLQRVPPAMVPPTPRPPISTSIFDEDLEDEETRIAGLSPLLRPATKPDAPRTQPKVPAARAARSAAKVRAVKPARSAARLPAVKAAAGQGQGVKGPPSPKGARPAASRPAPPRPAAAAPVTDDAQKRERRDVERQARNLEDGDAELRGKLRRVPFARLLQRLYARRAAGSLLLLRGTTKKIVVFSDGYPVSVRSNVLGECLGQILLEKKLISKDALDESLRRMKAEKRQQGQILVDMGALSPYNLDAALVEQMEAKLFEPFGWSDGQFTFKEGPLPPGEPRKLDRSTAALILEGIRRHYDVARQNTVLDGFVGKYVSLSRNPVLRLQEMTADPTELSFVYGIDGTSRLEAVMDHAAIPRDKARLLLVALAEAGMIEPSDAAARHGNTGVVPNPFLAGSAATGPSRDELHAIASTMRAQNHFEVLGVGASTTTDDVQAAYESLAREYHADRFRGRTEEVRHLAQEIFDRLTEAERVIGADARRKSYAARLDRAKARQRLDRSVPSPLANQYYKAGTGFLRDHMHREAVDAFRQAARIVPDNANYRAALGWALFREAPADQRTGRAALGELRRAVELDAGNHKARIYLGHFYAQTGKPDLAIQEFETALRIKPGASDVEEELRRLRSTT